MTQEGLLRTLLQRALRNSPHLVPLLFLNRLETFVVFGDRVVWQEPWVSLIFMLIYYFFSGDPRA